MKIKLPLLFLILCFASCSKKIEMDKDTNSISLKEAINLSKSAQESVNVQAIPTQTEVSLNLRATNMVGEVAKGSSCTIDYPYKKGSSYSIRIEYTGTASEVDGDILASTKRIPHLQLQYSKSPRPTDWAACGVLEPERYLSGDNVIILPTATTSGTKKEYVYSFTPDDCSNYLIVNTHPDVSGRSNGRVQIKAIITETKMLDVTGPSSLNINEVGNYSIAVGGFPVSSNFRWRVTGDLQIVGTAVGPAVVIMATSLNGGAIIVDSNDPDGCTDISSKIISSNNVEVPKINSPSGTMYSGNSYMFTILNPQSSVKLYTWSVTGGSIMTGQGTNVVEILFDSFGGTAPRPSTISVVAAGIYESKSAQVTKSITKCNNCPIN